MWNGSVGEVACIMFGRALLHIIANPTTCSCLKPAIKSNSKPLRHMRSYFERIFGDVLEVFVAWLGLVSQLLRFENHL